MSNPYIWAGLQRANNDPTTIDEAIAEGIAAHNDDVDAHLGADQSLQSHRASEIIDHRAESVVNDKIKPSARVYTAIVDPSSESDFGSIEAAVEYTLSKLGGVIYIVSGTHYISTTIEIPLGISIVGDGIGNTIIECSVTGGPALLTAGDELGAARTTTIRGLSFDRVTGSVLATDDASAALARSVRVEDCGFENGGSYIVNATEKLLVDRCQFEMNTTAAMVVTDLTISDSNFTGAGAGIALAQHVAATDGAKLRMTNCTLTGTGSQMITGTFSNSEINGGRIGLLTDTVPLCRENDINNRIIGVEIIANGDNDLYIRGRYCRIESNDFTGENGDESLGFIRMALASSKNLFVNNIINQRFGSDRGVQNIIQNVIIRGEGNYDFSDLSELDFLQTRAVITTNPNIARDFQMSYDGAYFYEFNSGNTTVRRWAFNGTSYAPATNFVASNVAITSQALRQNKTTSGRCFFATSTAVRAFDMNLATPVESSLPLSSYPGTPNRLRMSYDESTIVLFTSSGSPALVRMHLYKFDGTNYVYKGFALIKSYTQQDPGGNFSVPGNPIYSQLSMNGDMLTIIVPQGLFPETEGVCTTFVYDVSGDTFRLVESSQDATTLVPATQGESILSADNNTAIYYDNTQQFYYGYDFNTQGTVDGVYFDIQPAATRTYLYTAPAANIALLVNSGSNAPEFYAASGLTLKKLAGDRPTYSGGYLYYACSTNGKRWLRRNGTSTMTVDEFNII